MGACRLRGLWIGRARRALVGGLSLGGVRRQGPTRLGVGGQGATGHDHAGAQAASRGGHAGRQGQLQPDFAGLQITQDDFEAGAVLGADPVEHEAVGHAHRHQGGALGLAHFGRRQGADPGVELLFRQFGGQALTGPLPQGGGVVGALAGGGQFGGTHVWTSLTSGSEF